MEQDKCPHCKIERVGGLPILEKWGNRVVRFCSNCGYRQEERGQVKI